MSKIKHIPVFSFDDRLKYLKDFNSDTDIWVVPDLVLKKRIKNILLKDNLCTHSGSVIRAQEFWQFLFKRLYPEFMIKEDSLIIALLKHFLYKNNLSGFENENYIKNLFLYIKSFLPIFTSVDSVDHFLEWLKKNPDHHLEKCFKLSFDAWKYLLSKKIVSISFLTGILSSDQSDLFFFLKEKKIIFDLGFQMQALEAECIKNLSKISDIKILKPSFYNPNIKDSLWTYKLLEGVSLYQTHLNQSSNNDNNCLNSKLKNNNKISFFKYSNQLAEIRGIILEIKKLLNLGVSLNDIAIVSADIEYLWPILSLQLSKEKILVNKPVVSSLHSDKSVMLWLAKLRVALGGTNYPDIEMSFACNDNDNISYKDLKYNFFNTYSVDSYKKTPWSNKLLKKPVNKNNEINLLEFLDWAFSFWGPDNLNKNLLIDLDDDKINTKQKITDTAWQQVYHTLRESGSISVKLSVESWMLYAEDILSKKTYSLAKESYDSISCYNISNSDNLKEKYIILSDLSFNSLKNKNSSTVSFLQALSLSEDLGISLEQNLGSSLESILKYMFQLKNKVIMCSWSAANLESKGQTASTFFLEEYFARNDKNLETTNIQPDQFNKSDLTQIDYKKNIENFNSKTPNISLSRVLYDKGEFSMKSIHSKINSTSVTGITRYISCPFIFFSEKILKLQDIPDWDLDISSLEKGSLFHKLLELIITENIVENDDIKLLFFKLNIYRKNELKIDDNTWAILQKQLTSIAKNFIELEKNQKLSFPELKIDSTEHSLQAFWSKDKKSFLLNDFDTSDFNKEDHKNKDGLLIKGKADRIDISDNGVVIRDYKTSVESLASVNQWKNKQDISLFLYYKLWQACGGKKDFLGAFYLGIKNLKSKGVLISEDKKSWLKGFPPQSVLEKKDITKLFLELDKSLEMIIENILNGSFAPLPKDKNDNNKICDNCKWSGLCRISETF